MRILHLSSDEKFVCQGVRVFDHAFPSCNEVWIITEDGLKYSQENDVDQVIKPSDLISKLGLTKVESYDYIVLHMLDEIKQEVVLNYPHYKGYIWLLYGAEVYGDYRLHSRPVISDDTLSLVGLSPFKHKLKLLAKKAISSTVTKGLLPNRGKSAMRKISYFGMLGDEFVDFRRKGILSNNCRQLPFCYYPLDILYNGKVPSYEEGNQILIGNAASLDNNHIDILKLLDRQNTLLPIVLPLSYGDTVYRDKLMAKSVEILPEVTFTFLKDFMPMVEYHKVLNNCEYVILNNWRQQGFGTILSSIYMGKKVWLHSHNALLSYLQNLGLHIYNINTISKESFVPLTMAERNQNIRILQERFTLEKIGMDVRKHLSRVQI